MGISQEYSYTYSFNAANAALEWKKWKLMESMK